MSWRMQVRHRTELKYASEVALSFNEARMTPLSQAGQLLIAHDLDVRPRAVVARYVDYWGTTVEAFDLHEAHVSLAVTSTSLVDTAPHWVSPAGVSWADVADDDVQDKWVEYLKPSQYVDDAALDPARAPLVESLRALRTPAEAARTAREMVRDHFIYIPGVTTSQTTAQEAWEAGRGVCQDFTHAMIALLRSAGVPARYVSGYLHSGDGDVGETVVGESHSWVEVWDGGWGAFDPTNGQAGAPAHVAVARGRDYGDVPPLKGVYAGGTSDDAAVQVQITRLPR